MASSKRERILIDGGSSNSGKAKIIYRVVRSDDQGSFVYHNGHKAYLIQLPNDSITHYKVDYWL